MEPSSAIASVLPQLSIGVVCVLTLLAAIWLFVRHIKECNAAASVERTDFLALLERKEGHAADERLAHNQKIEEHHRATSALEAEMRGNVLAQIRETTAQLKENTHLMTRVIDYMETPEMHPASAATRARRKRTPST